MTARSSMAKQLEPFYSSCASVSGELCARPLHFLFICLVGGKMMEKQSNTNNQALSLPVIVLIVELVLPVWLLRKCENSGETLAR